MISLYNIYKNLLKSTQQEIFEMFYFDDLTVIEIAQINKITRNAVYKNLLKITNNLQKIENSLQIFSKLGKINMDYKLDIINLLNFSTNQTLVEVVDENDITIGHCEKLKAHQLGLLHRAISVFLINENDELLLQQRSNKKYHGRLMFANTCCSHPFPGEDPKKAASRRLEEELGIKFDNFHASYTYKYHVQMEDDLSEHEFDHIFIGNIETDKLRWELNRDEVEIVMYKSIEEINQEIETNQHTLKYAPWFIEIFPQFYKIFKKRKEVKNG